MKIAIRSLKVNQIEIYRMKIFIKPLHFRNCENQNVNIFINRVQNLQKNTVFY
jgi:hypothetical protein